MNTVLWIIAGVLAAVFLGSGAMKLGRTREQLAASGLAWTQNFGRGAIKAIGALEVLGAAGLVLPPLLGIAEVLAPVAAMGLAVLMVGAAITHLRRKEAPMIAANAVLLAFALIVVWGRFGPYAFGA